MRGLFVAVCLAGAVSLNMAPITGLAKAEEKLDDLEIIQRVPVDSTQDGEKINYQWVDEDGNELQLESAPEKVTANAKRKTASLPGSYSSLDKEYVTEVKNQGYVGTCWAFSSIKLMESSAIIKGLATVENVDYAESHLAWFSYNHDTLTGDKANSGSSFNAFSVGGSVFTAMYTYASWMGATDENSDSRLEYIGDDVQATTMSSNLEAYEQADAGHITDDAVHLTNAYDFNTSYSYYSDGKYVDGAMDTMKQAIVDYGSLSTGIYIGEDAVFTAHYNDENNAYYQKTYSNDDADHQVTIIGWNDDFSADKFNSACQPDKDGAWLVMNSWGTDWGENGCFWLSYYDTSIAEMMAFEVEDATEHDVNFQYDSIGYAGGINANEDITLSNVFTNDTGADVTIDTAGLYTLTDGQEVTVRLYKDLASQSALPDSGTKQASVNKTINYSGYHTVDLGSSVLIDAGETFAVVVTYEYNGATVYVPVEGDSTNGFTFTSEANQSYILGDNTWSDLSQSGYHNALIKAIGNKQACAVSLSKTKYAYNGKVKTPEVKVYRADGSKLTKGTDYTVTYPSGRKKVGSYTVTVKGKGDYEFTRKLTFQIVPAKAKITSLKAGKKNLTVTLAKKPAKLGAAKYQVQYKKKGASKWKSVKITTKTKVLKKLKAGKKYKVRVRAFKKVGSKTYYGAWSKVKTSKKIKKKA
ncbi:MAG: fibronectin type III domain-containing protein [Eubacterium sp.]|nr:fibronectin type III domain-containing protein [Eubacterium sp.]